MCVYLANPSAQAEYDTGANFKRSFTHFNKPVKEPCQLHCSSIARGIIAFITFPRVLALCEVQRASC